MLRLSEHLINIFSISNINQQYTEQISNSAATTIPPHPPKIPFPWTEENAPKLEQYIHSSLANTALGKSSPIPSMSAPPIHIHLKSNVVPYAKHTTDTPCAIPLVTGG